MKAEVLVNRHGVAEKKAQKTARKQQRRQASEHSSKTPEQLTFIN
jgi:hypothetical protein